MKISITRQEKNDLLIQGLLNSDDTRREPPTMGKQLVNFITCGCTLFVIYSRA
jgi:hypothetical protein